MSDDEQLPALRRLTSGVSAAMRERERRASTRRRLARNIAIAVVGLPVVGGSATAAIQSLRAPDPIAGSPPQRVPPGYLAPRTGPPVYIARGRVAGLGWGVTARPCTFGGVTTMALAIVYSDGSAGADSCRNIGPRRKPKQMAILAPEFSSAPGAGTFFYGVVPARVKTVELHVRRPASARSLPTPFRPRVVRVQTRSLLGDATRQGGLPSGYRVFVAIVRRFELEYTRAVAFDSHRTVILDCARRECDHLARQR